MWHYLVFCLAPPDPRRQVWAWERGPRAASRRGWRGTRRWSPARSPRCSSSQPSSSSCRSCWSGTSWTRCHTTSLPLNTHWLARYCWLVSSEFGLFPSSLLVRCYYKMSLLSAKLAAYWWCCQQSVRIMTVEMPRTIIHNRKWIDYQNTICI